MFNLNAKINNKKILIYGFGKSGQSSYNYLKKLNKVSIFDDYKKVKKNFISKKKVQLTNFDYIVLSPGIDINKCKLKKFLNKNRKKIITDLDIFYLNHEKNLKITITGTNGKTTVSYLVHQVLNKLGFRSLYIGTLTASLTTPESLDIQRLLSEHVNNGGTHCVLEVSSHGIDQHRIGELLFDVKLLTNITQDHLDYHKTFQNYYSTKMLFMEKFNGYSIFPEEYKKETVLSYPQFLGRFNKENLQAAKSILKTIGVTGSKVDSLISVCSPPPGRFEPVQSGQPYTVIIDYAHTPDALDRIIDEGRQIAKFNSGNVMVLFGCGGDRDKGKRAKMGKIASEKADYIVVTMDNPRFENPDAIFDDIVSGIPENLKNSNKYKVVPDRKEAIEYILQRAQKSDVVIVAGKGHETTQIIKDQRYKFDDKQVALEYLNGEYQ